MNVIVVGPYENTDACCIRFLSAKNLVTEKLQAHTVTPLDLCGDGTPPGVRQTACRDYIVNTADLVVAMDGWRDDVDTAWLLSFANPDTIKELCEIEETD